MKNTTCLRMAVCAVSVALAGQVFGLGAPTDLAAAAIDFAQDACALDCSAQLSWTAPAEGTPTGYRIYRRLAAHEGPTLAGTVDAATTTFTDTAASAGRQYLYTVTAVDADGESAESASLAYRKVFNVARQGVNGTWAKASGEPLTAWGNWRNWNNLSDGVAGTSTGIRIEGNGSLVFTFDEAARPKLTAVRAMSANMNGFRSFYFQGEIVRDGSPTSVAFDGGSTTVDFPKGVWTVRAVDSAYADDAWRTITLANTSGEWQYPCFSEVEAYGYLPDSPAILTAPVLEAPVTGDCEVFLTWPKSANAVSHSVYRKTGSGDWERIACGVADNFYKDTGLADGTAYTYRVASVGANGDESSDPTGVTVTATGATAVIPPAYGLAAPIDFTQAACEIDCSARLSWSLVTATTYDKVRVYRFIRGHEDEQPAPIATLDKATTAYVDSAATVGREYVYTVACYDSASDREGPRSPELAYRRLVNVARASRGHVTLNNPVLENGKVANVNDGALNNAVCKDNSDASLIVLTFPKGHRPRLGHVRLNFAKWTEENYYQYFYGKVLRDGSEKVTEFDGTAKKIHAFTQGDWNQFPVADSLQDDIWTSFTFGGGNYFGNCREIEAYGYLPDDTADFLAAPEMKNPVAGRRAVALAWSAAANAVSYKVYRKPDGGDWTLVRANISELTAEDDGVAFDGTTYVYRVAAVAANGDELSSEPKTVLCSVQAPFWWNFLNVKCFTFPGAAGYANPAAVKPHFLGRDRAGTLLAVPMSTDDATQPAVTFDLAALASADSLGELSRAGAGFAAYAPADFGGDLPCWKGAAVSDDLIVIGNGAAGSRIAVVTRATGACETWRLLDETGAPTTFALDGGLDFDASGSLLYSNDGATPNAIVRWQVDASAKTLKKTASFTADGFTRIRNLSVCTIGGAEYALFGEGSAGTGRIGALKLADGTVATLVTDAENLGGDITNVKLAAADGETYVVAQLDTGAVAVYGLDASALTATLERAIDAATMKSLCGAADATQCRNLEMTADGRYAFLMNNAGAETRLAVVGASERIFPEAGPALAATSDYANGFTPTLTWTEPAGAAAEAVRLFRRQPGKAGARVLADVPFGTRTFADTTAAPGVTYAYSAAYLRTVNGQVLAGPRGAEVASRALIDLKTKRKAIHTSDSRSVGTLGNLFDDNTATIHTSSQHGERDAMEFTERVQLMAARYMPANWGTVHRGDNLKVSGNVANAAGWTQGCTQIGTGPVVESESTWYDVTLNDAAAPETGWDFLVLASGYDAQPWLNLREVDFYGATVAGRAAVEAKVSDACRDDAPAVTEAACAHTLSWTESGSLIAVRILRARTADGPFVEIARLAPGVGTFVDETAVDGVTYYYRLAYVSEFEGVVYEGAPSDPIIDCGVELQCDARSAILQSWTDNWTGGHAFTEDTGTVVNGPAAARFGLSFAEPVRVGAIALRGPDWAVGGTNGYRIDSLGIYAAPAGIAGIADTAQANYKEVTSEAVAQFARVGTTPDGCHVANTWYVTSLPESVTCSYLYCSKDNWFASISGMRVYGYPQRTVDAAKAEVVWPVENLTVTMSDRTAKLAWSHANALATSVRIDRQVNGGAWTTLATLGATATSYDDATAEIGAHNVYRVWTADAAESVYAAITVTPLLAAGDRAFVKRCSVASDPLFVDAFAYPTDQDFKATYTLAGTTAAALGVSGDVRLVAVEGTEDGGNTIQVIRDVASGDVRLYLKGPGHETGTSIAAEAAVPESDALRLEFVGLTAKAFYHTEASGWVAFAEAVFSSAPFAGGKLYAGLGTHTTGVTEETPTAFSLGAFKLRRKAGSSLIVR